MHHMGLSSMRALSSDRNFGCGWMGGCGKGGFLNIYSSIFCVNVGLFSISPSFGSLLTPYLCGWWWWWWWWCMDLSSMRALSWDCNLGVGRWMDVRREKSTVWGWRNFVAAACRRRRRRCCRLTPSPSSSSYLSAPEVFSLLAFNLRSRARAASSTAVRSFFRSFCRSFRASRLRFWCSIIAVRFVQSFVYPLRLTSPSTGIHALSWDCRLVGEAVQTVCGHLFWLWFPPFRLSAFRVSEPLSCLPCFRVAWIRRQ